MKTDLKVNLTLRRSLEKGFFFLTFENIKKHEALEKLKLTDEEILQNRYEVKQVIHSCQECGDSKVFCHSLKPHYQLKRNQDNQLILVTYQCKKQKDYKSFSEEELNKKINDSLKDSSVRFGSKEVIQAINACRTNVPEIIKENGIGKTEFPLHNLFFAEDKNTRRYIIYLFHAILINMDFVAIKSEQLKKVCLNKFFSKDQDDCNLIDKIKNVPLLVIIDFGIESHGGNNYYYFDIIPEILEYRYSQEKITCIFSPIKLNAIYANIRNNGYYKGSKDIQEIQAARLNSLEETLKLVFNPQSSEISQ